MKIDRSRGRVRPAPALPAEAAIPLGKQLAHTDKRIRDQAVSNLASFLSHATTSSSSLQFSSDTITSSSTKTPNSKAYILLPPLELRKLWRGLFYCFWMSDKPLVQQRLASDLGELILMIDPVDASAGTGANGKGKEKEVENEKEHEERRLYGALEFVAGFWEALVREWPGIDRLRMDKYLMLIRRFQSATFRLLARHGFPEEGLKRWGNDLSRSGGALSWDDSKVLPSLSYHLSDIYLEELSKLYSNDSALPQISLPDALHPFILLLCCTNNPTTYTRLVESIFGPLLKDLTPTEEREESRGGKRRKLGDSRAAETSEEQSPFADLISHSTTISTSSTSGSRESLKNAILKRLMAVASGTYVDEMASEEEKERVKKGVKDTNRRKVYGFVREWGGVDDDEEEDE